MTSAGYLPLWRSILQSSIMEEDLATRFIWITMLIAANRDGTLKSTPYGISRLANVPLEETRAAMKVLMAPDPQSGSTDEEGRRILEISPNVWQLVNYEHYQDMARSDRKRQKEAERSRRYRERQDRHGASRPVTDSNGSDVTERDGHGSVTDRVSGLGSGSVLGKEEEESEEEKRDIPRFIMDEWNGRGCVPRVRTMTDTRRSSVSARARQHGGEDAVFTAVLKRSQSDFLSNVIFDGKGAPFDWVMGPKNFPKVLEGNFDNDRGKGTHSRQHVGEYVPPDGEADEELEALVRHIMGHAMDLKDLEGLTDEQQVIVDSAALELRALAESDMPKGLMEQKFYTIHDQMMAGLYRALSPEDDAALEAHFPGGGVKKETWIRLQLQGKFGISNPIDLQFDPKDVPPPA